MEVHTATRWLMNPHTAHPSAESVLNLGLVPDLTSIPLRDDSHFVPNMLVTCYDEWEFITREYPQREEVLDWIKNGVNLYDFFVHFKGSYKGVHYDHDIPPTFYAPNLPSCKGFGEFIARTLEDRIRNGSIKLLGKIGECPAPRLIMPITVEPNKPRMCHDERFLNSWCKDCPFSLDTLKLIPRLVNSQGYAGATLDHKSGILFSSSRR